MRVLMASISFTAVVFLSGCATLQKYPAFGNAAGGRLVLYDRQGAKNVLPPSPQPGIVLQSQYSRIR
jgi:hypothetical protein